MRRELLIAGHACRVTHRSHQRSRAYVLGKWKLTVSLVPAYSHILPPSPLRRPILGLALLSHLSTSRISQFHTMLEELSTTSNEEDKDILNDVYIRWPVELERSLMEGSYTKAWRAKSRAPRKEYEVLAEGLMGTIR